MRIIMKPFFLSTYIGKNSACVKAVFVTATFYKPFCNELYHRFPRMKVSFLYILFLLKHAKLFSRNSQESVHVISDSLNLANYRVKYTFVRYSANSTERVGSALTILPRSKVFYLCACRCLEYLLRFLQGGRDLKTIIFCNTLRTAALLSSLLSKSRISHSYWNGSLLYTVLLWPPVAKYIVRSVCLCCSKEGRLFRILRRRAALL
jgi:hypothetical protein